jgi:hypothetical protein
MTEQLCFDFDTPQHDRSTSLLETLPFPPGPTPEPEPFFGLFLPQWLREDVKNGRFSRGRAQSL